MVAPRAGQVDAPAPFRLWEQHLTELEVQFSRHGEAEGGADPRLENGSGPQGPLPSEQAQEILDRARRQADIMLMEARRNAERLAEQARQDALEAVATAQGEALREFLELLRHGVEDQLAHWFQQAELEAVELCVTAAERVIRDRVQRDDEVVVRAVQEALEQLRGASAVVVHVHPESLDALNAAAGRLAAEFASAEAITVECVATIPAGGAVVRSDAGEVDLRIETQVQQIRKAALAAAGETTA